MTTQTKKTVPAPAKKPAKAPEPPPARISLTLREGQTVIDAAERMKLKPKDLIARLAAKGFNAEAGDLIDEAFARAVTQATLFDAEFVTLEQDLRRLSDGRTAELAPRPPVVTIMGHVDHGKTTLLDAIRSSHLVDKESGGITQHIGAYRVTVKGRPITFIDTPGHEAFTQLRSRGAKLTDIVVLVVAADDGIMPQTREAIDHARAAGVPLIVAINKIDKPEANIERVKQQLVKENLLIEEYGGKTICLAISAKEKKNIGDLLEMILLQSDMLELKANPKTAAQGVILEARMDAQRGPVGTVIVQQGTLLPGQAFLSGLVWGKVRAFFDENGKALKSAGPSTPAEVLGFDTVPEAGAGFQVVPDVMTARTVAEFRRSRVKKDEPARPEHVTLEELFRKVDEGQAKELVLILKADVQGSVEVLRELLPTLETEKVKIRVVAAATGAVSEADVLLASASNAVIIAYNVKPSPKVLDLARKEEVEIRSYRIIYELTEEVKKAVLGLLEPVIKETVIGRAEIRKIFQIPKIGAIAGCYVTEGRIARNAEIRILRGREVVHQGRISSLRHVKENVNEVKANYECGIGLAAFNDPQPGDVIEAFIKEKVRPI